MQRRPRRQTPVSHVSTPEPTPTANAAQTSGRRERIFFAFFVLVVSAVVVWGLSGAPSFWTFLDYHSVIVEERELGLATFREVRVYDQARIDLPPGVELVLPMTFRERVDDMNYTIRQLDVMTRADGKPGEVLVLTETHYSERIDAGQSRDLPTAGGWKVWKRQTGSVLAIDVQHGSMHSCSAQTRTVIFVVPPGQSFRQEPPSSPAFAGHSSDEQEKATGWEFVLTRPLARGRFR
jgi:hypothetical protein